MATFAYFPLLPRDIQLIIWELYEARPGGIRHHLTVGHRQIAYAAADPSRGDRIVRNAAGEDDPAEVRLDPFCRHKFDKIRLATPAFSAPPGRAAGWSALGEKWPVTERPAHAYADLARDVFVVDMTTDAAQLDPRASCLGSYPAVCWMPEDLAGARHVAVPTSCRDTAQRMDETFSGLGHLADLRTVRVVLRVKPRGRAGSGGSSGCDRPGKRDGDAVLRRMRDLPRDSFGFVQLGPFCEEFSKSQVDEEIILDLFGIGIGRIRSASWCNRYIVKYGVEKIPVIDGFLDVES